MRPRSGRTLQSLSPAQEPQVLGCLSCSEANKEGDQVAPNRRRIDTAVKPRCTISLVCAACPSSSPGSGAGRRGLGFLRTRPSVSRDRSDPAMPRAPLVASMAQLLAEAGPPLLGTRCTERFLVVFWVSTRFPFREGVLAGWKHRTYALAGCPVRTRSRLPLRRHKRRAAA